jgi:hypothetical protein
MRSESFSRLTVGEFTPPVWKDVHALRSELNSSVKYIGKAVGAVVGVGVAVSVNVAVAVAGAGVGDDNSTCVGTGVGVLQAVRSEIPISVRRSGDLRFMPEL